MIVGFAELVAIGLLGATLPMKVAWLLRQRRPVPSELGAVMAVATKEAERRRHDVVSTDHVAWVLLGLEEVADALAEAGADVATLRADVGRRLQELYERQAGDGPIAAGRSQAVKWFVRTAVVEGVGATAQARLRGMVAALASDHATSVGKALAAAGLDGAWAARVGPGTTTAGARAGAPYREGREACDARIVLTGALGSSIDAMADVLRDVAALGEPEARYRAWLLQQTGEAPLRMRPEREARAVVPQLVAAVRRCALPVTVSMLRVS